MTEISKILRDLHNVIQHIFTSFRIFSVFEFSMKSYRREALIPIYATDLFHRFHLLFRNVLFNAAVLRLQKGQKWNLYFLSRRRINSIRSAEEIVVGPTLKAWTSLLVDVYTFISPFPANAENVKLDVSSISYKLLLTGNIPERQLLKRIKW